MGKKKHLVLLSCILLFLSFPYQVRAEYYENHVDRGNYCMQARNVRITEEQRIAWLKDGTLQERIIEKSGVFTNCFHPSDSTKYWTEYDGDYEVDMQALMHMDTKSKAMVPVTFYLTGKKQISITINVEVTASEVTAHRKKETGVTIQTDTAGRQELDVQKQWRLLLIGLTLTILAILGFGNSLYSDFRVLKKYRQKQQEGEKE